MNAIVGATGCVGSRLARRLLARGELVRALVRPGSYRRPPAGAQVVTGDLLRSETLPPLVEGARVVYFLAHAMGNQPHGTFDLVKDERRAVESALDAARAARVARVVFLSGLGASANAASEHLRARFATEEVVRRAGIPWTIFRAGVLLGPGSVGFEVLVRTVARARVLPLPPWREMKMQPYALSDMLDALVRAGHEDAFLGRTVEVGTRETPSYGDLLRHVARSFESGTRFVNIPVDLAQAMSLALSAAARTPVRMATALVDTLVQTPAVVQDGGAAMRELGLAWPTLDEALGRGLRDAIAERERALASA